MSKSEHDMKVLKKFKCESFSGKSSLSYELATDPTGEIHIRITKNTGGGGMFSKFSRTHLPRTTGDVRLL